MNILFFSRLFYPHIGGVEKHVLEVGKILAAKSHKVTVITEQLSTKDIPAYLQSKKKNSSRENVDSIEIHRIYVGENNWFKKFRIWIWLWRNRALIKEADIVHCHDVFFWYLPFKLIYPKKPVYTTFHGYEGSCAPSKKAILIRKVSEKLSLGNICVGDFLRKWYGTKPDYVIYGGVDAKRSKFAKTINNSQIAFIGRLEHETGILEYLKALKLAKNNGYKFQLTVCGDGSLRDECEHFVKINHLNVKFNGFVKDASRYIEESKTIFTSRYLGILESLVKKKFVFAVYNNEIKKDYLTMTPFSNFISISASEKEIFNNMKYFLHNPKLMKEKIDKGYDWVENQTWDKVCETYFKLWHWKA